MLFKASAETVLRSQPIPSISAPTSASPRFCTWADHDPSPAPPHDRAGRRHLARPPALGCLAAQGSSSRAGSLTPVPGLFLASSRRHQAGHLNFFGVHAHLDDARAFKAYLARCARSSGTSRKASVRWTRGGVAYFSRYYPPRRHLQPALITSNHNGVTFRYKDYRADGRARYKVITLGTHEFRPPLSGPRPAARLPPHPPATDCLPIATAAVSRARSCSRCRLA